ncbi:MAG: class I SAM-dependent methyltransferase [Armatimonadota bacterium]|nr:MAG: class I SAM-dependent methyltransferase [Armatimonadota bacterium]
MPGSRTGLSAAQAELLARLEAAIEFARAEGLDSVVGWCMAAAQGEIPEGDLAPIIPIIAEFVRECAPAPARVLDVGAGTGSASLALAADGYELSLLDPAAVFLETAQKMAEEEGEAGSIRALICATFTDLEKLEPGSYDVCLCLRSLLYVHPRREAEEILLQLGRIAAKAVVVDVASKYGLVLQLGKEFDMSAQAVEQILTDGTTPAARPEHGGVVYSCFSSDELGEVARHAGLTVRRLVGYGITETLELGQAEPIPADEAQRIEALLQTEKRMLDTFPSILALCTRPGD